MNLETYQTLAMRTKPHPDPDCDYLELAQIGMVGELGELAELLKKARYHHKPIAPDDLLKECGDLMWYLAVYADTHALSLGQFADAATQPTNLTPIASALAIANILPQPNQQGIADILRHLATILHSHGFTVAQAAELNIAKLRRRYPAGFELTAAQSHDGQ
jgi:NTP pyrophosphatase (non-canonical NTP hydrolase)